MPESLGSPMSPEEVTEALRRIEQRLQAIESWQLRFEGSTAGTAVVTAQPVPPAADTGDAATLFDLTLTGRTLIILGGAFLLRAATEAGALPPAAGVGLGLAYALAWTLFALRPSVSSTSAAYFAIATALTSIPLVYEGTRKFHVFTAWSAALALSVVAVPMFVLIWRKSLHGAAWLFTAMTVSVLPLLMVQTRSIVPFAIVLLAFGIVTLWYGYLLDWTLLPWFVALVLDLALLVFSVLTLNESLPDVSPATVIGVHCLAFAAYLASFAIRALGGHRDAAEIDIAQTFVLLLAGLGAALWIATSRSAFEVPLIAAMLILGATSYAVSFTFVARRFTSPRNFVFTSSLALLLIVMGGAFLARGLANSAFWTTLALGCAYLATHFRKSSLALHAAVYLSCGFVGADVFGAGQRMVDKGVLLLFVACTLSATIRPIERKGTFELWTAAKVILLAELGWITATLVVSTAGRVFPGTSPAVTAVLRTAVLAALTVTAAWVSRFPTLSPARKLVNPLMIALALKLLWEDVRTGSPATLFVSFAIVGAALILTPRFRRRATLPQPMPAAALS